MAAQRWTTQQVLALAPDPQAVRAARALTSLRTWADLGCTEALVWGKCQGTAKDPYQVTVDLNEPAFRCTCPSRKFPCKHALALLLLWVEHGDAVAEAAEAGVDSPASRNPPRPSTKPANKAVDPEAQAR